MDLVSTEMKKAIVHCQALLNISAMLPFTYGIDTVGWFFTNCGVFLAKKCFLSSAVFNGMENGDEET